MSQGVFQRLLAAALLFGLSPAVGLGQPTTRSRFADAAAVRAAARSYVQHLSRADDVLPDIVLKQNADKPILDALVELWQSAMDLRDAIHKQTGEWIPTDARVAEITRAQLKVLDRLSVSIHGDSADMVEPSGVHDLHLLRTNGTWKVDISRTPDFEELRSAKKLEELCHSNQAVRRVAAKYRSGEYRDAKNVQKYFEQELFNLGFESVFPTTKPSPATHPTVAQSSDAPAEHEVRRIIASGRLWSVSIAPGGKTIASGAAYTDEPVVLWNVADGRKLRVFNCGNGVEFLAASVRISPDGKLLAVGGCGFDKSDLKPRGAGAPSAKRYQSATAEDFAIRIFSVETGNLLRTLAGHTGTVQCVAFSSTGNELASAASDGTVCVWDPKTGTLIRTIPVSPEKLSVAQVAFRKDKELVTYDGTCEIRLFDVQSGSQLGHVKIDHPSYKLAISPDGTTVACSALSAIHLIDLDTATLRKTLPFKPIASAYSQIDSLDFSPDGKFVIAGDGIAEPSDAPGIYDGLTGGPPHISVLDVSTGHEMQSFRGHVNAITGLAVTEDGKFVVSTSDDGSIRIWSMP
jgi:WD40 repeat protein